MFILNGQPFDITSAHSIDGVNYPAGFFANESTRSQLGIIEVADPVPTPPTREQLLANAKTDLSNKVQFYLDSTAQSHGYDGIISACSYAAAPNVFQTESIAFLVWRSAVWAACYMMLNNVVQNNLPIPTWEEVQASLPVYGA